MNFPHFIDAVKKLEERHGRVSLRTAEPRCVEVLSNDGMILLNLKAAEGRVEVFDNPELDGRLRHNFWLSETLSN
jgi:hypothetical protein